MEINSVLKEMNGIVKFTLEKHGVKAKWRIIPLTYDKWERLSVEKTAMDKLAWELQGLIKKQMERKEIKDLLEQDKELKRKIDEGFEMEKEIEREYGRVPTLEENLNSNAIKLAPKTLKHLRKWRKELSFCYKLFKKNKDADFLILLNVHLASGDSRREKLETVVHETLHFIEDLKKTRSNFESIENEVGRIVDEFLFSEVGPINPHT